MRALLIVVTSVVACACASSGGPSARRDRETVRIQGAGTLNITGPTTTASMATVAYPIDQAWAAVRAVYDSLAIPITTLDPTAHTIGNSGFKIRGRLGKTSLSRFLECGSAQMVPSADSHEIYLIVSTRLKPAEGGASTVETVVQATARSVQFSQPPSQCSSKGELEKRVATLLALALAQAQR